MVRQICYVAYRGNGFTVPDVLLKFDAVLVIHPDGRQPGLIPFQSLVIQGVITHKFQNAGSISHQIYHPDIFPYNLRLKAVFLIRFARTITLPEDIPR